MAAVEVKNREAARTPDPGPDGEAAVPSSVREKCTDDPNFAVLCAFFQEFGAQIFTGHDVRHLAGIGRLQSLLESSAGASNGVPEDLKMLHVKLLRKLKKTVSIDKWEKALVKFANSYSTQDGWELDRFGYRRAPLALKLRLLKNLLESQFDGNVKFKQDLNSQKSAKALRMTPLGTDKMGNAYWYQLDRNEAQIRVYKDDPDEETWELVAETGEQLQELIAQLKDGPTFVKKVPSPSSEVPPEEDSLQDYSGIIRDTRPSNVPSAVASGVPSTVTSVNPSDNEDDSNDVKDGTEKQVLRIKPIVPPQEKKDKEAASKDPAPQLKKETPTHDQPKSPTEGENKISAEKSQNVEEDVGEDTKHNKNMAATHDQNSKETPAAAKNDSISTKTSEGEDKETDQKETVGNEKGADKVMPEKPTGKNEKSSGSLMASGAEGGQKTCGNKDHEVGESITDLNKAPQGKVPDMAEDKSEGSKAEPGKEIPKNGGMGMTAAKRSEVVKSEQKEDDLAPASALDIEQTSKQKLGDEEEEKPKCSVDSKLPNDQTVTADIQKSLPEFTKASPLPSAAATAADTLDKPTKMKYSIESFVGSSKNESEPKSVKSVKHSVANMLSSDYGLHGKRPCEDEPSVQSKRIKEEVVSEEKTEATITVEGNGSGAENQASVTEEICEAVMFFSGRGTGVECDAKNRRKKKTQVIRDEKTNGKLKKSPPKANGNCVGDDEQDDNDEEEKEKKDKPKLNGKDKSPVRVNGENDQDLNENTEKTSSKNAEPIEKPAKKRRRGDPVVIPEESVVIEKDEEGSGRAGRRSSGRIALMRIKEAERRQREEEEALHKYKESQSIKASRAKKGLEKYRKLGIEFEKEHVRKKKRNDDDDDDDFEGDDDDDEEGRKRKRRRKKKKKKARDGQHLREFEKFSSGSDSDEDGEGGDDEEEVDESDLLPSKENEDDLFRSDHEFSCESDVPDDEVEEVKHARTATKRKRRKKEVSSEEEEEDDFACKKCSKSDSPEWILLCDKCDAGWHASCLRPTLLVIPEGDWFCPDCSHAQLVEKLEANLTEFLEIRKAIEAELKKQEANQKRKERLAYVTMSLSNIIPEKPRRAAADRDKLAKFNREAANGSGGSESSSSSGSSSDSDDSEDIPIFQRRRATKNVNYNMKEYDVMMKNAIDDGTEWVEEKQEVVAKENVVKEYEDDDDDEEEEEDERDRMYPSGQGRGKDMANIYEAEEDEEEKKDDEDDDADKDGSEEKKKDEEVKPKPIKMKIETKIDKKKKKRLTTLDESEEDPDDGDSGSDFRLSGDESEDDLEEPEESEESDYGGTSSKKEPVRRSNRSRKVIYDDDFVIDGSGSEDELPTKRKAKYDNEDGSWDSEDSEDENLARKKKKKKKRERYDDEDDLETWETARKKKKKKLVVKGPRKTRQKNVKYSWSDEDPSEDEIPLAKKKKRKVSDSEEDEFVVKDEESKSEPSEDDDDESENDDEDD